MAHVRTASSDKWLLEGPIFPAGWCGVQLSSSLRLIDEQAVGSKAWMGVYLGKTNSAVYHGTQCTLNTRM